MKWACITRFYDDGKVSSKVVRVPENAQNRTHDLGYCEEVIEVYKGKQDAINAAREAEADTTDQDNAHGTK